MLWLERWWWHQAAKAYAHRLGPCLAEAYGGEAPYTPEQVATAVHKLNLDPRFIAVGYSEFVEASVYEGLRKMMPKPLDREVGRLLYDRYKPWVPAASDTFEPPPERFYSSTNR